MVITIVGVVVAEVEEKDEEEEGALAKEVVAPHVVADEGVLLNSDWTAALLEMYFKNVKISDNGYLLRQISILFWPQLCWR